MNVFETRLLKVLGDISTSLKSIDRKLEAKHFQSVQEAQAKEAIALMKEPYEYK